MEIWETKKFSIALSKIGLVCTLFPFIGTRFSKSPDQCITISRVFSFWSADTEILSDCIGILKKFLIIIYIYPPKEYFHQAQRTLLFISDAFILTNICKYDINSSMNLFYIPFPVAYLHVFFFQDLLSIANVAEQHEVWDFLSVSSKVFSFFDIDVWCSSLVLHLRTHGVNKQRILFLCEDITKHLLSKKLGIENCYLREMKVKNRPFCFKGMVQL